MSNSKKSSSPKKPSSSSKPSKTQEKGKQKTFSLFTEKGEDRKEKEKKEMRKPKGMKPREVQLLSIFSKRMAYIFDQPAFSQEETEKELENLRGTQLFPIFANIGPTWVSVFSQHGRTVHGIQPAMLFRTILHEIYDHEYQRVMFYLIYDLGIAEYVMDYLHCFTALVHLSIPNEKLMDEIVDLCKHKPFSDNQKRSIGMTDSDIADLSIYLYLESLLTNASYFHMTREPEKEKVSIPLIEKYIETRYPFDTIVPKHQLYRQCNDPVDICRNMVETDIHVFYFDARRNIETSMNRLMLGQEPRGSVTMNITEHLSYLREKDFFRKVGGSYRNRSRINQYTHFRYFQSTRIHDNFFLFLLNDMHFHLLNTESFIKERMTIFKMEHQAGMAIYPAPLKLILFFPFPKELDQIIYENIDAHALPEEIEGIKEMYETRKKKYKPQSFVF